MLQVPEYIQILKAQFESETQPFRKVHRLIDLSEAVIKFHTVVIVSNFMESKDISDLGRSTLASGLKTPSLGIWAFFTEKIHPLIPKEQLFWKDFPEYFSKTLKKATDQIIPFRNHYAHGSTPDDEHCLADIQKFYPFMESILGAGVVGRERLEIGELLKGSRASHAVILVGENRTLNLSPLLVYRESEKRGVSITGGSTGLVGEPSRTTPTGSDVVSKTTPTGSHSVSSDTTSSTQSGVIVSSSNHDTQKNPLPEPVEGRGTTKRFFYFNDLRNEKKVSLLNYEASEHIRDEELKKVFDEVFPLKSWEKKSVSPFKARIEELTENFKGRREELSVLQKFFSETDRGHFFIWGGPGIGKSTLVARALQLSRASQEKGGATEEEAFAVAKNIHFIEYFIRRGTDHARTTTYLKYMSESLEKVHSMGIPTGVGQDEMGEKYFEKLRTISEKLEEKNEKLVLFIDGLDEADDGFLRYLPTEGYKQILVVFSTRELPGTREIYLRILENKEEIILHGLGTDVIRALLYDVVDKYEIQKEYIDGILTKSEGNPLYLKLLLNSLAEKEKKLNDISALPKGVYDFYQEILNRLQKSPSGTDIYKVLYLLTITKDYLCSDTISYFTNIDRNKVDMILSDIREILFENPFTTEVEDFQLFHESLREFFKEKYPKQLNELRDRELFPKLRNWESEYATYKKDKSDPYTIRYILSYAVTHFLESQETISEAETLVLRKDYVETQLDVLQFYTIPLRDAGLALKQIIAELGGKPCTTRPLSEILKPKITKDEKFRTTTFVQLVNHTGELSHKASTDIGIAWKWIEEGKVAEALERLSPIQDKQRLFDCYLLALWLLTLQPDGEANRAGLKLLLEEVEINIPPAESKSVKWHERYTVWFFAELCQTLIERELEVKGVFDRGDDGYKKDVILTLVGYEKVGDKFELIKLEECKEFIKKYINKVIYLARGIETSYSRSSSISIIGESVAKLGEVEFGKNLFQEAVEVARGIEDSYDRSSALSSIGESVAKLGDVGLGKNLIPVLVEVARGIKDSEFRSIAISIIGESVAKLGDVELGKNIFPELVEVACEIKDSHGNRSRAIISLGESVVKLGDKEFGMNLLNVLLDVARRIDSSSSRCRAIGSIGGSVAKLGEVEFGKKLLLEAVEIALGIGDSRIRSSNIRNLGELLVKLGNVGIGKIIFPLLIEATQGIEGYNFHSITLKSIVESVANLRDVEFGKNFFQEAIEVVRSIENANYRSDVLGSIVESVAKLGDVEFGKNLFQEAVEVALGIKDSYNRCNALISIGESVVKLGDIEFGEKLFQEALEVALEIESDEDRISALRSIEESVARLGDVGLGKNLIQEAVEVARGIETSYSRSSSISSLGELVAKLGDVEFGKNLIQEAVEVARGIEDSYDRSSALRSIGESVAKLGDMEFGKNLFQEAVEAARGIEDSSYRSRALWSIGESVAKLGNMDIGKNLFPVLVEVTRDIEDSEYRSSALSSIGESVAKIGDVGLGKNLFQEALEVARGIKDSSYRSSALCRIGESVAKLGNMDIGKNLFPVLVEVTRDIEDSEYRSSALSSIGESVEKIGDVGLGKNLFQEALEVARGIKDSSYRSSALCRIGESVAKLGNMDIGKNLFPVLVEVTRDIEDSEYRSSALSSIGESVVKIGDVEFWKILFPVFMEVVRGIEDDNMGSRSNALSSLGESVVKLGDVELGKSIFSVLVEEVRGIKKSINRSCALVSIGESVAKLGNVEFGMNLFQEALEIASRIESYYDRSSVLSRIGESVGKLGDVELGKRIIQDAVEVTNRIKDHSLLSSAIIDIGDSVAKLGDMEFGKYLSQVLKEVSLRIDNRIGSQSKALRSIANYLAKLSLYPEALEVTREIDSYSCSEVLSSIGELVAKLEDMEIRKNLFPELLEVARGIEYSEYRSSALHSIGKSVAKLRESEFSQKLLSQILEMGYQLKVSDHRKNVIQSIAKATSTFGTTSAYSFFETNHESHPDIPEVVKAYTEEYRKIRWEEPGSQDLFPYYIRSFGWVPFEGEFAKEGAYDIVSTLAKLGMIEEALEAGRGIGMIPEEPRDTFESELAELDRLLAEEEITKKVYQRKLDELKGKYGVSE